MRGSLIKCIGICKKSLALDSKPQLTAGAGCSSLRAGKVLIFEFSLPMASNSPLQVTPGSRNAMVCSYRNNALW